MGATRTTTATVTIFDKAGNVLATGQVKTNAKRHSQIGPMFQRKLEAMAQPHRDTCVTARIDGCPGFDGTFALRPVTVNVTYKGKVLETRLEVASSHISG